MPSPCNSNEECVRKGFDKHECRDPCDPNPCQKGGSCVGDNMGNHTCNCGNYSGTNCEIGKVDLSNINNKIRVEK